MNWYTTLAVVCLVYYILYRYFSEQLSERFPNHRYYFGGFLIVYLLLWYLVNYEYSFVHKTMRNIYDTTQEPLYSHTSAGHNSDYYYANNGDIKPMLVNRQANRCYKCSNLFMNPEEAMLSYKIPLQYGGKNEPHNLVAVCPTCSQFL